MKHLLSILLLLLIYSCKQETVSKENLNAGIAEHSIDDSLADSLIYAFKNDIFAKDMNYLRDDTTFFQFYKIDLNKDSEEEIFIRLMTPYFCASSGCTYLLLNQQLEVINRFITTNPPIIATQEIQNGWRVLLTEVEGEMKMLINKNNRYPSNPSMAVTSDIPISRDDIYMFDDEKSPSKTYQF